MDTRKKISDEFHVPIKEDEEMKPPAVGTSTAESQASTTLNQTIAASSDQIDWLDKSDKRLVRELEQLGDTMSRPKEHRKQRTKIQEVPTIMKDRVGNPKEHYHPREVSIGPIHAKNTRLVQKKLKHKLAAAFIQESRVETSILLHEIKNNLDELKKFFDEKVIGGAKFKDGRLARMFFLDGCAVLQFMHSYVKLDGLKQLEINNSQATLIQQDLFLLENQIPFFVLKLLIKKNSSDRQKELVQSIYRFISMNIMVPQDSYAQRLESNLKIVDQKLDLFLGDHEKPVHLLDLLRSELLFNDSGDNASQSSSKDSPVCKQSFRNVQELKATGIKFKPSKSCSFRAISFNTKWLIRGQLMLPQLVVDNSTAVKFWNLVAHEMCADEDKSIFGVTSYLSFLDSLIDNEDVKDLRAEKILRNRLSSDAEVAQLFNTIGSNLVPDKAYSEVKDKIQKHFENKYATWIAQVCHDHFRSPWTIVALFAAVIALLLTGFGTWFTIYPRDG